MRFFSSIRTCHWQLRMDAWQLSA